MRGCQAFIKKISSYIDNELGEGKKDKLEAHIAECPGCFTEARRLKAAKEAVVRNRTNHTAPLRLKFSLMDMSSASEYRQPKQTDAGPLHSLGFDDAEVPDGTHICLFYENEQERIRIISEYFKEGVESSNKCHCMTGHHKPLEIIQALLRECVELQSAIDRGQLSIDENSLLYSPEGDYDPKNALARARHAMTSIQEGEYTTLRLAGEVNDLEPNSPKSAELIEFERRANYDLFPHHSIIAICQYDLRDYTDDFLDQVLKAHPYVITNGRFKSNPYYTESA